MRECFFFKQKPAYEMRISDWSSDVCSSDLLQLLGLSGRLLAAQRRAQDRPSAAQPAGGRPADRRAGGPGTKGKGKIFRSHARMGRPARRSRSEEHTSELQSLMRISYAVFCLKKKHIKQYTHVLRTDLSPIHTNSTT